MKCKFCDKEYFGDTKSCPYCGKSEETSFVQQNEMGSFMLSSINMLLVFAINASIAALIINLFIHKQTGFWFQYVVAGIFSVYTVLRGFFGTKKTALRTIRNVFYYALVAFSISAIAYNVQGNRCTALNCAQYIIPSIILGLTAFAFVFLFFGLASTASFGFTCLMNTVSTLTLLVISLIAKDFNAPTLIYVSFGVSVFSLANHAMLWILSLSTKIKRSFK